MLIKRLITGMTLLLSLGSPVSQAVEKIIIANGGTADSLQGQTARRFSEQLQARLGDQYQVEYYSDAKLGDEKDLLDKLRNGQIQLATISSIMSAEVPEFALFDMPFLVRDRQHLKLIDSEIIMTDLAAAARRHGLHIISTWENGFRQISNNSRPIRSPEDLKGLRIRTPQSEWRSLMFASWGAKPTQMPFSHLFVALQTGEVDGEENPLSNINGARLQNVQKFLSISNHVYSPIWLTASDSSWQQLPAAVQAAITEVAADAQRWSFAEGARQDTRLLKSLGNAGVQINHVDRITFIAASKAVYAQFARQVKGGDALIERVMDLAGH
ncbi:C4-dicarboxylate ABC transporter [Pokkaliibacter plantistimulans]|uniref:C4-dicarboxylate ABC transporter n=1 Tax=Pokkaliibacter plantistimulans TaxID=1635171 RepID=A0ABX5LR66_9GAMM|nr:TRAP transporter substrate-binding protein [Pokkaliibacter plantistimulans]PXF29097.1 C4-dicarboxylate ABC transporter [Pokkaliibacter plantistimulans]